MEFMNFLEMPELDQVRFALAARRCLQAGERFDLAVDFDHPMIELHTADGRVLERWSAGEHPLP
jgi:hypothetical protein